MANLILIFGKSGSGKSASIRTLDAKETIIFNVLNKRLPFKGANKLYNEENKNIFGIDSYDTIHKYLQAVSERRPEIKNVIIDDATYLMRKEMFKRAKENGFNKFVEMAQHFQELLNTASAMRDDINVFLIMHSDEVTNGNEIDTYKVASVGKMLDEKYNPAECVTVCLYSDVTFDGEGRASYGFYTNVCHVNGKRIPAKSPEGMFDELFIQNDLKYVVDKINEYYN